MATYALFDTGANASAITRAVSEELALTTSSIYITLNTFDASSVAEREIVNVSVSNLNESLVLHLKNVLVADKLSTESEKPPRNEDIDKYYHLEDVILNELENRSIGLLLDTGFARYFLLGDVRSGVYPDEPIAIDTEFGWAILGPTGDEKDAGNDIFFVDTDRNEFDDHVRYLYRQHFISDPGEDYPAEVKHPSVDDEFADEQLLKSVFFDEQEARYSVCLPWTCGRTESAEILNNIDFQPNALNRLNKLKLKLQRDEKLKLGAFAQIKTAIDAGWVEEITCLDAPTDQPVCYLPNHIVLHPDKPGKVRITQDAASKVNGISLNKLLSKCKDRLKSLVTLFIDFREKKVVLTADIADYFYQILVDSKDRSSLRFHWWSDISMTKPIVLQARVHIFGLKSSPGIASFVLQYHAHRIKDGFPLTVFDAMLRSMYVDDLGRGFDETDEAIDFKTQYRKALAMGGFPIVKWKSNFPIVSAEEASKIPYDPNAPPAPPQAKKTDRGGRSDSSGTSGDGKTELLVTQQQRDLVDAEMEEEERRQNELAAEIEELEATGEDGFKNLINKAFDENCHNEDVMKHLLGEAEEKILGVGYCYESDQLNVRIGNKGEREVKTKRDMLSWLSSIYDPMGYLSPFVLKGRQFFQMVMEQGTDWKQPVDPEILDKFNKYKESIVHLKGLKIPRWTNPLGMKDSHNQLIIFCDASITGFGFTAYLRRSLKGGGPVSVAILFSKSHVVPLNMSRNMTKGAIDHRGSIPRLELCAATLAAKWRDELMRTPNETYHEAIIFCDSLTVIRWLEDYCGRLSTFEHFRIGKIRSNSWLIEWWHLESGKNVGDLNSRGIDAPDKEKWQLFHNGPPFLLLPQDQWPPRRPEKAPPAKGIIQVGALDVNGSTSGPLPSLDTTIASPIQLLVIGATKKEVEFEIEKVGFEPWPLLATKAIAIWGCKLRRIAIVVRCLMTWKKKVEEKKNGIVRTRLRKRKDREEKVEKKRIIFSPDEMENAESLLVRSIQAEHFEREIVALLKVGVFQPHGPTTITTKSRLTSFSPFLDPKNLIRVGGRIGRGEHLPLEMRYPVIMPDYRDENTKSLIRHFHAKNLHCSRKQTLTEIQNKFHILGGRTSVDYVINRCLTCQRLQKLPGIVSEGQLPVEKLTTVCPFQSTGLDLLGPFHVRHAGRGTKKRWALIATCMTTRAVCLFGIPDLTSSAIINALIKFNAQCPMVKKIFSDQGSNFKGADREMREALEKLDKDKIISDSSNMGIEWVFGPANDGAAGGSWERLIGMIKKLLRATIGTHNMQIDDFDALLAAAAAVMNRRPLTRVSAKPGEEMVLSPAHFLFPYKFSNALPNILPPPTETPKHLTTGWKSVQVLLDDYWKRFQQEYLGSFLRRQISNREEKINLGELVLMVDSQEPREYWRIMKVVEITNADAANPRHFVVVDGEGNRYRRSFRNLVRLELTP